MAARILDAVAAAWFCPQKALASKAFSASLIIFRELSRPNPALCGGWMRRRAFTFGCPARSARKCSGRHREPCPRLPGAPPALALNSRKSTMAGPPLPRPHDPWRYPGPWHLTHALTRGTMFELNVRTRNPPFRGGARTKYRHGARPVSSCAERGSSAPHACRLPPAPAPLELLMKCSSVRAAARHYLNACEPMSSWKSFRKRAKACAPLTAAK